MSNILKSINKIENLQVYAENKRNPLNALNPIVKIVLLLTYVLLVVSCKRNDIFPLIMLSMIPVITFSFIDVPAREIFLRIGIALPFALFACVWNIFLDKEILFTALNIAFTGGVISFIVIIIKTILSVSMVLALSATTKMTDISVALKKMKMPEILITQLLLTYRYLLLLFSEAFSVSTAANLRSGNRKYIKMKDTGVVIGTLLLKSISRAERVYTAMTLRGFKGYYFYDTSLKMTAYDFCFLLLAILAMCALRYSQLAIKIGEYFI